MTEGKKQVEESVEGVAIATMNKEILIILRTIQEQYQEAPESKTIIMNLKTVSAELNKIRTRIAAGEPIKPEINDQPRA